jgi:hypothetical protein
VVVRFFKYKWFARFAEKAGITDDDLRATVKEIEAGLVEANYGGMTKILWIFVSEFATQTPYRGVLP